MNTSFKDLKVCSALFILSFCFFLWSPISHIWDSRFSLLVSLSIIQHGSIDLGHYNIPLLAKKTARVPYQIQLINGKPYCFFPIGGAILSVPYVAVASSVFHNSPAFSDGWYNPDGEKVLQKYLAAILMAALTTMFYLISRFFLAPRMSIIIALGGSFGSQVWSTTSRQVESNSWVILLLAITIFLIVKSAIHARNPNPIILSTLLSWMYFVRPTSTIDIIVISIYVLIRHRKIFLPYVVTGLIWFSLFIWFSYAEFGMVLPSYYQSGRLLFFPVPEYFLAHLISPSRGLLVFLPWTGFAAYLIIRYFHLIQNKDLVLLSVAAFLGHLLVVSAFSKWWGGHSYGPRMLADVIPWIVLISICGCEAWQKSQSENGIKTRRNLIEQSVAIFLLALSVLVNGYGALSLEAWNWNIVPKNIDRDPSRAWDWHNPQFWPKINLK